MIDAQRFTTIDLWSLPFCRTGRHLGRKAHAVAVERFTKIHLYSMLYMPRAQQNFSTVEAEHFRQSC